MYRIPLFFFAEISELNENGRYCQEILGIYALQKVMGAYF